MSATQTAPVEQDFDAAVDAFLEAPQRPDGAGTADAPQADPSPDQGMAPVAGGVAPASVAAGEPGAAAEAGAREPSGQGEEAPTDYKALYEEMQRKTTSEAAKELSAAGRLPRVAEELKAAKAEAAREKARAEAAEARRAKDWDEAINLAPETTDQPGVATKARLRELRDQELHESQLASREQRITQVEEREQQQAQETKAKAARDARVYAVGEHYLKSAAWEAEDAVPEGTYQPVRDFLMQPAHRALANSLPLVPLGEHERIKPPGDPLSWQLDQLPDLHSFYLYLQANSNAARDFYKRDHAEKQTKAEQERVAANAQQASKTYQPEKPIGTAGGPSRRSFEEMDFDEAVDAFFPHP